MRRMLTAGLAFVLVLGACGGDDGGDVTATPVDAGDPITLRMGTDDGPGRRAADQIEHFAGEVADLSGGELLIEPVWHAAGRGIPDWDQEVARMVVDGELEMGMIPTRAWDTEGVSSLRALNAPFLVTSDEHMAAIATSDLAGEMLEGLEPVGITGLALVPESLRRLLWFDESPGDPDDLGGRTVRAPRSDTAYAVIAALGGDPADLVGGPGDAFADGIESGEVAAAESAFWLGGSLPVPTTGHAGAVLYPKLNSIVVNTEVFDELSSAHRDVLRDAATRTVDWAISTNPSDAEDAEAYCRSGGRVVAGGWDADAEAAARSVYDDLETHKVTKEMIDEIRSLDEGAGSPPAPCEPQELAAPAPPADGGSTPAEFPVGTYEMEITVEALVEGGVDRPTARNHAGTWTVTFEDGRLTATDVNAESGERSDGSGVYCIEDGRIHLGLLGDPPECGDFLSAGWHLDGDQLWFTGVQAAEPGDQRLLAVLVGGVPWTRIA
jgi:TRAP-type transport system periplasmic protein